VPCQSLRSRGVTRTLHEDQKTRPPFDENCGNLRVGTSPPATENWKLLFSHAELVDSPSIGIDRRGCRCPPAYLQVCTVFPSDGGRGRTSHRRPLLPDPHAEGPAAPRHSTLPPIPVPAGQMCLCGPGGSPPPGPHSVYRAQMPAARRSAFATSSAPTRTAFPRSTSISLSAVAAWCHFDCSTW
jgi:hypothetical protein